MANEERAHGREELGTAEVAARTEMSTANPWRAFMVVEESEMRGEGQADVFYTRVQSGITGVTRKELPK